MENIIIPETRIIMPEERILTPESPNFFPFFVAICGPSGSGKTTVRKGLAERFDTKYEKGTATNFDSDRYYRDQGHLLPEERDGLNYDDFAVWDNQQASRDISLLLNRQSIHQPIYEFATHTRIGQEEIYPSRVILGEGIFMFLVWYLAHCRIVTNTPISSKTDDSNPCYVRRKGRDIYERGRTEESVDAQWPSVYHSWKNLLEPHVIKAVEQGNVNLTHPWTHPKEQNDRYLDEMFKQVDRLYVLHQRHSFVIPRLGFIP